MIFRISPSRVSIFQSDLTSGIPNILSNLLSGFLLVWRRHIITNMLKHMVSLLAPSDTYFFELAQKGVFQQKCQKRFRLVQVGRRRIKHSRLKRINYIVGSARILISGSGPRRYTQPQWSKPFSNSMSLARTHRNCQTEISFFLAFPSQFYVCVAWSEMQKP